MGALAINGGPAVRTRPFPAWPQVDADDERSVLEVVRSGKWWMCSYSPAELNGGPTREGAPNRDLSRLGTPVSRVEAFEQAFARFQHVRQLDCFRPVRPDVH